MLESDANPTQVEPGATVGALGDPRIHEFIRYFVASLLALVVDVGTLFILVSGLGLDLLLAGAIAFMAGLTVIYLLSTFWVFDRRNMPNWKIEFVVFVAIGLIGLVLNEIFLWFLADFLAFHYLVAKVASIGVVFFWNFLARKYTLFS